MRISSRTAFRLKRSTGVRPTTTQPETGDRFEKEELGTHEKRREAFLDIAEADPLRCRVVDASGSAEEIADKVFAIVEPLLPIQATRAKETGKV